jgi:hypothetical protein
MILKDAKMLLGQNYVALQSIAGWWGYQHLFQLFYEKNRYYPFPHRMAVITVCQVPLKCRRIWQDHRRYSAVLQGET